MNIAERTTPFTKKEIIEFFNKYVLVQVTFFKVSDGSLRTFTCTRNAVKILEYSNALWSGTSENLDQVRVFSVEDNGWRSFLVENLVEIEGVA